MVYDEPTNRMVINGFMVLENTFTKSDMVTVLESEIIPKHPKMTKYVVSGVSKLYWKTEDDFKAEEHVWTYPQHSGTEMNKAELDQLIGQYYNRDFPKNRSPYEFIVVENFENGQSAVIFRFHHSLADGIGFIKMMIDASDAQSKTQAQSTRIGKAPSKFAERMKKFSQVPQAIQEQEAMSKDSNPLHGPELRGDRYFVSSDPIDLQKFKDIKNAFGCTINDIMIASLGGAFREYFKTQQSEDEIKDTTIIMPINMRSQAKMKNIVLENDVSAVVIPLFSSIEDREERLAKSIDMLHHMKESASPLATYFAFKLFSVLPHSVLQGKAREGSEKCTSTISNVPGPREPIYYLGNKVTKLTFVPPAAANIGVGVSLLSYANQVTVAVATDSAVSETPGLLTQFFVQEIEEYYQLAMRQN